MSYQRKLRMSLCRPFVWYVICLYFKQTNEKKTSCRHILYGYYPLGGVAPNFVSNRSSGRGFVKYVHTYVYSTHTYMYVSFICVADPNTVIFFLCKSNNSIKNIDRPTPLIHWHLGAATRTPLQFAANSLRRSLMRISFSFTLSPSLTLFFYVGMFLEVVPLCGCWTYLMNIN